MDNTLITGASGFIGSHLTELCVNLEYHVKAFIHYNSRNLWGWLDRSPIKNEIEIISGDIRDFDSVYRAMDGCAQVFHLAALIGIPYSYISPLADIKTNIEGTYNILEAARLHGLDNILITSTSETYGTAQTVPICEEHPLVGQSPYSASKIAADQLAISYHRSFDMPVKIVRPFNTFGPRQSARAIIPTIISQLLAGKKTLSIGNTTPTRDFTYVKDTAAAFIEIARCEHLTGQVTNVGMNEEIAIADLVNLISELLKRDVIIMKEENRIRPDKSEVERLRCDNRKIMSMTQWKPEYNLRTGLIETIQWLEQHLDMYKPEIYNV